MGSQRNRAVQVLLIALCSAGMSQLTLPAGAEQTAPGGSANIPSRIANHQDHKAYQPRRDDVCEATQGHGLDCAGTKGAQADDQLKTLYEQLMRASEPERQSDRGRR
jgi:hypothetical protein